MKSADIEYVAAATARRPVVSADPERRNVLAAFPLQTWKSLMQAQKT